MKAYGVGRRGYGMWGWGVTRAAALFWAIFTGFTGLVYQVTWQKYLATLLGSHSEATAAVLGAP